MSQIAGSYLVLGDGSRPSNHYRLVDGRVQFSKDGKKWRTLSDEDLKLHLTLETPLAPWLKSRWEETQKPKRTAKTRNKSTSAWPDQGTPGARRRMRAPGG